MFGYSSFRTNIKLRLTPYKSLGLVGADAVEDHVKGPGQKTALAWGARHGEGFTTPCNSVCKQQPWNTEKNHYIMLHHLKREPL